MNTADLLMDIEEIFIIPLDSDGILPREYLEKWKQFKQDNQEQQG